MQHIMKYFERVKRFGPKKVACKCFIKTTHGLSYACELANIQIQGDHVTLESIHMFWSRLHIKENEVIEEGSKTQLALNNECEELKRYFSTLDIFS